MWLSINFLIGQRFFLNICFGGGDISRVNLTNVNAMHLPAQFRAITQYRPSEEVIILLVTARFFYGAQKNEGTII